MTLIIAFFHLGSWDFVMSWKLQHLVSKHYLLSSCVFSLQWLLNTRKSNQTHSSGNCIVLVLLLCQQCGTSWPQWGLCNTFFSVFAWAVLRTLIILVVVLKSHSVLVMGSLYVQLRIEHAWLFETVHDCHNYVLNLPQHSVDLLSLECTPQK